MNHKKVRRLMREHDLQPRVRRRYVTTTDSNHDSPIFPNLARDIVPDGPDQLWVADLTYVAVTGGFVYVAIILDAWSRRVVGYALSRSIDARLTVAALRAAIERRRPAPGLTHHTDRGSQPNTLARRIGRCWSSTGSSVRWADAATPTTVRAKPNDRATRPLPIYLVGVTGTTSRNYTISKSFLHWNDLKEIINHKLLSAYR